MFNNQIKVKFDKIQQKSKTILCSIFFKDSFKSFQFYFNINNIFISQN